MTEGHRTAGAAPGLEGLYPFLYGGPPSPASVMAGVRQSVEEKVREIVELRDRLGRELGQRLSDCGEALARAFRGGAKLLAFGNGGSSTDAQAVVRLFLHPPHGRPLPALALTNDVAVVTALANDVGFEVVFARQVAALGAPGDIAIGLSTSGNSANVIRAFDEAGRRGLLTVGFAGYDGGAMAQAASIQHLFVVPSSSVHRIQEAQTTLYHVLWEFTRDALTDAALPERG